MKGYEWGTGTVRCGFCRILGHNITSCSHVSTIYRVYLNKVQSHNNRGEVYFPTPLEKKAVREMQRREKRSQTQAKPRKKARCSFCNSTKHKRNKCPKLAKFKAKVRKANENWRRAFVSEMTANGFGIGSLIDMPIGMLEHRSAFSAGSTVGIIASYNKEKLNVFCAYPRGGQFQTIPSVDVIAENQVNNILVVRLRGATSEEIVSKVGAWRFYEAITASPERNPEPLSESWYKDDEDDKAMQWFYKNISLKSRDYPMLLELIKKWT